MINGLTKRQQQILRYIEDFLQQNHHAPSYREIMRHFGFTSVSSVAKHIQVLKNKGTIDKQSGRHRSLQLTPEPSIPSVDGELEIPLIGQVTMGAPLELFPKMQMIPLPRTLVPNHELTYVLRVRGPSIIDEHVTEGDLLIIETRKEIASGELILALLKNNQSIVKRYYPEGQHIRLDDKRSGGKSLLVKTEDLRIQGVIIGLIRLYS